MDCCIRWVADSNASRNHGRLSESSGIRINGPLRLATHTSVQELSCPSPPAYICRLLLGLSRNKRVFSCGLLLSAVVADRSTHARTHARAPTLQACRVGFLFLLLVFFSLLRALRRKDDRECRAHPACPPVCICRIRPGF